MRRYSGNTGNLAFGYLSTVLRPCFTVNLYHDDTDAQTELGHYSNLFFTLYYTIGDDSLTVGERDSALAAILAGAGQLVEQSYSEAEIRQRVAALAAQYSSRQITFETSDLFYEVSGGTPF